MDYADYTVYCSYGCLYYTPCSKKNQAPKTLDGSNFVKS